LPPAYDKGCNRDAEGNKILKQKLFLMLMFVILTVISLSGIVGAQDEAAPITVENAANVVQLAVLQGHTGPVFSLAFSPDGTMLASGGSGQDFTVRLWDVASGVQTALLEGHTAQIAALSFNADGTHLETAGYDGTIRLWDAATGAAVETIDATASGDAIGIDNLMTFFSADGSRLVYYSEATGSIAVFDMATRDQTILADSDSPLADVLSAPGVSHLSADGKWLAAVDDTSAIIEVWNVETGEALPNITGHKPAEDDVTPGVYGLAFNADGSLLASASYDATVRLWNPADGTELVSLPTNDVGGAGVVIWSPDGSLLASGNVDGTIQVWGNS
jgi:Tol biopolymer transport system component